MESNITALREKPWGLIFFAQKRKADEILNHSVSLSYYRPSISCIYNNMEIKGKARGFLKYCSVQRLLLCLSANPREKAMVEFFYSTGCRLDEVYKLDKQDIDWNRGAVNVIGKGDKERTVYLNAKAKVHLWKYLETRTDKNEALFVSERAPHKRLGHRAFQMDFNALGKAAGIIKPVHPHLLRHTMATIAVNNGANIQTVQRMLGHTDPATTQIYAELNNDEIQMNHKRYVS